jgi:hypothetical protein
MGQSSGLSSRAELDEVSGAPGVSPSRIFIDRGEIENAMCHYNLFKGAPGGGSR